MVVQDRKLVVLIFHGNFHLEFTNSIFSSISFVIFGSKKGIPLDYKHLLSWPSAVTGDPAAVGPGIVTLGDGRVLGSHVSESKSYACGPGVGNRMPV